MMDEVSGAEIARLCGYSSVQVSRIRSRVHDEGIAGVHDKPRSGRPPSLKPRKRAQIVALTLKEPDKGIGSLEVGKLADLIIVDTDSVNMTPLYDVYSALAYAAHPRDVRTVVVNGRVVVRDRRVLNVDVVRAKGDVRELTEQIASKASEL